jgi:hypothetical protein
MDPTRDGLLATWSNSLIVKATSIESHDATVPSRRPESVLATKRRGLTKGLRESVCGFIDFVSPDGEIQERDLASMKWLRFVVG